MSDLFAPLRRPVVWIVFVAVLGVAVGGSSVFVAVTDRGVLGTDAAGVVLVAVGFAFVAAGAALALTDPTRDDRLALMHGVDRSRRRRVHRAVVRADMDALPEQDLVLAYEYADAYVAFLPKITSIRALAAAGYLLGSLPVLAASEQSSATLVMGMIGIPAAAAALIVGIPLTVRWYLNARELVQPGFDADGAPSEA